jgi:hypothetical protein
VDVADDLVAEQTTEPLKAVPDDGRAEVADVHRLRHVRPAEVDDHGAGVRPGDRARAFGGARGLQRGGEVRIAKRQVDEAGAGDRDRLERPAGAHVPGDRLGDLARVPLRLLRGDERADALELAEVGTVRQPDLPEGAVEPHALEGVRQDPAQPLDQGLPGHASTSRRGGILG